MRFSYVESVTFELVFYQVVGTRTCDITKHTRYEERFAWRERDRIEMRDHTYSASYEGNYDFEIGVTIVFFEAPLLFL